jgi:hypothetical protein
MNDITAKLPKSSGEARERAAADVGVSPRYVSDAKQVKADDPETLEAVKRGAVTIPEAKRNLGLARSEPPQKREPPDGDPTIGELFKRGGVSLDDAPRRSEEEKALYPTWTAILKVATR